MYDSRGFTLLETIIVIGVFSIASLMVFGGINSLYRDHAIALEQATAIQGARTAIERLATELRRATQGSDGAYSIESMDPYALTFYANIAGDDRIERVRYELVGEDLVRGVTEPSGSPLSYDLSSEQAATSTADVRNVPLSTPLFRYYDTTGAEITDMDDVAEVRFVSVRVTININPARLPTDFTLYSSAALRNLKDNL